MDYIGAITDGVMRMLSELCPHLSIAHVPASEKVRLFPLGETIIRHPHTLRIYNGSSHTLSERPFYTVDICFWSDRVELGTLLNVECVEYADPQMLERIYEHVLLRVF